MKPPIKFLTYLVFSLPGIIIHEFSHKFFCDISGVKVLEVCFFQLKNPAGYVKHQEPRNFLQSFLIVIGPFLLGSLFAFLLFYYVNITTGIGGLKIIAIWFGISIATHSFPSSGDAKVLLQQTNKYVFINHNIFAIILYPFVLIIKIINFLKRYYLDFIYALFLFALAWYVVCLIK